MNRKIFTIIIFSLMMFGLGVRAATAQWVVLPDVGELPNALSLWLPMIFKNSVVPAAPSPTGALFVLSTTATTDGNGGGRVGMNEKCSVEDTNSHFCTIEEIENAFSTTGVYFASSITDIGWLDEVDVSSKPWTGTNCGDWTQNASGNGRALNSKAYNVSVAGCGGNHPVTCCKWIP